MEILICSVDCPYPLNAGGNQAAYNMIDFLRKLHKITLLCLSGDAADISTLQNKWPDVHLVVSDVIGSHKKKLTAKDIARKGYSYIFRNKQEHPTNREYLRNKMMLYNNNFFLFSAAYTSLLTDLLKNRNFDIIQVEFVELLGLVYGLPDTIKKVFVHHEIRFLRLEQERNTLPEPGMYEDILVKASKEEELHLLSAYDHIITLDNNDKKFLLSYLPDKPIYASPFAIEIPPPATPLSEPAHTSDKLVFIGGEHHYPNLDAIMWFTEFIWPVVTGMKPSATLFIIGNWHEETIRHLQKVPNVVFTGYIQNIEPVFSGAVMIVPVRIGSGIRVKILDAIAYKVPLVTTTIGKGGLPLQNGRDCLIADTEEDFASGILQLLDDKKLQAAFTLNAWQSIQALYTKEVCGNLRNAIYNDIFTRS